MSHHASRPEPARRIFTRLGSFDPDYGSFVDHPDDPRYSGPMQCPECMGTKYDGDGNKCPHCAGTGTYWESDE